MSDTNTIDDGGPAFPVPNDANVNGQMGLSLRDWFAGKAMQSGLTGYAAGSEEELREKAIPWIARISYEIADAMLKARKQ